VDKENMDRLKKLARGFRRDIVEMVYRAKSGHPGGSLSVIDILTYLFFYRMKYPLKDRNNFNSDRFVLSKGHATPAYYAVLCKKGFFDRNELFRFRQVDSFLQGHPENEFVPGVDVTTGSLGQGFPQAVGMALGYKLDMSKRYIYVVLGDGECQEGVVWEAAMAAGHYKLHNLIGFVDFNGLQIDGAVESVMNIKPIEDKFRAFNWFVQVIDGHSFEEIDNAVENAINQKEKPSMIIAKTVKGKGVSFMENNYKFHGKAPNEEEYKIAMEELK